MTTSDAIMKPMAAPGRHGSAHHRRGSSGAPQEARPLGRNRDRARSMPLGPCACPINGWISAHRDPSGDAPPTDLSAIVHASAVCRAWNRCYSQSSPRRWVPGISEVFREKFLIEVAEDDNHGAPLAVPARHHSCPRWSWRRCSEGFVKQDDGTVLQQHTSEQHPLDVPTGSRWVPAETIMVR